MNRSLRLRNKDLRQGYSIQMATGDKQHKLASSFSPIIDVTSSSHAASILLRFKMELSTQISHLAFELNYTALDTPGSPGRFSVGEPCASQHHGSSSSHTLSMHFHPTSVNSSSRRKPCATGWEAPRSS